MPSSQQQAPGTDEAEALLVRVAGLLHSHGTPAHRLERLLGVMAKHFGIQAQFLSSPTSLIASFGQGAQQRVRMLRIEPGDIDLGKLVEFDELLERVEDGTASIAAANERLDRLATQGARHPPWMSVAACGLASAGAATVFGGGAREVLVSSAIGMLLGVLARFVPRASEAARLFEPLSGFLAAFLALVCARVWLPIDAGMVTLSALIVAVPGLALTVAMIELATRHLVSGSARLSGAVTVFLTIALGVALGRGVGEAWLGAATTGQSHGVAPLPGAALWLAVLLTPVAFAVLFQARWRELPWILAASWIGYFGARLGQQILGADLGSFLGAACVGVTANVYARLINRPALVPTTPGILMLVPGSIGYRALDLFLAKDAVSGVRTAFEMILVATALVGGLLFANVVLPPRRTL